MLEELSCVALRHDLADPRLRAGAIGTVVFAPVGSSELMVEFLDFGGETIDVVTVNETQVRPLTFDQVRKARLREFLDRLTAQQGARLTLPLIRDQLGSSGEVGDFLAAMRQLQIVSRKDRVKTRRIVQVDNTTDGGVFYDLKALAPRRQRAYFSTLERYVKLARSNPLDARIMKCQRRLRHLLETAPK